MDPIGNRPLPAGTLRYLFFPTEDYKYFARAKEKPFVDGETIVKAAWAADAAVLCYARRGSQRMMDNDLVDSLAAGGLTLQAKIGENPNDWNAPGTQAFFATGNNFAILAFRGTEVDDPQNLHDDLDILLVPEPEYKNAIEPPLGHLSFITHLFSLPCLVHKGFRKALNRVWPQVYRLLASYRQANPNAEICITGHSLGGALALLTYSRFADPRVSAYTIGCPRVGNSAFRDRLASQNGLGHSRFVNWNDVVTHYPLESALYRHAPQQCYRFDKDGRLNVELNDAFGGDCEVLKQLLGGLPADFRTNTAVYDLPAPPGVVDHSPTRYCIRAWNCV